MGAKRTPDLIPLCHPIALHSVTVECEIDGVGVAIVVKVKTADRTGVEMEALTAVSVAALTIIDMVKAVDPSAAISYVQVDSKDGGRNGSWKRP
jgi:cyclic pyranopterin phosphate synthase